MLRGSLACRRVAKLAALVTGKSLNLFTHVASTSSYLLLGTQSIKELSKKRPEDRQRTPKFNSSSLVVIRESLLSDSVNRCAMSPSR